jgi:aspartate/methionine/tyrosine aminotransferase
MAARRYARRLDDIEPFRVMEIMERAKALEAAGNDVVHFEVGEPDFATAEPIVAAGLQALAAGRTKYTQSLGIPELRARIARYYEELVGLRVAPERVVLTAGASGGLLLACAALLDPGEEIALTDPGYPCNEVFVGLVNGVPLRVPVAAEDGFLLRAEALARAWTPRTRGLLLGSPANPTGVVTPRAELEALIREIRRRDGILLLDEIYQGLVYREEPEYRTGLELDDDLFVLNSFSKYFGMTGWRLGWMVVPESALDAMARLAQNLFISPSSIAQHAALAAFEPAALAIHEERRACFAERRDRLHQGLLELGLGVPVRPEGAFYLYVDIGATGMHAYDFCLRLLEEYQVAVTPGIDFGAFRAERFVRFAYTTGRERIELGLERLGLALTAWGVRCS